MARKQRGGRRIGVLTLLVLLAGGLLLERLEEGPARPPVPPPTAPAATAPAPGRPDLAAAAAALDALPVEPETRRGYHREDWPHWIDADGDCQDTRDEVLIAESLTPVRLSSDGCRVEAGLWRDPYTGETVRDPRQLDIDHRVPLQEAHQSGGGDWTRDRRAAYANDLADPRTLVAVTAAANRAKGAKGPEDWQPPDHAGLCPYVADWIAVKARWGLSMDERERVTVGNMLSDCRDEVAEAPPGTR